jgi:hypothetical protein
MGTRAPFKFLKDKDFAYAVNLVETVTWLAGKPDYLDDLAETIHTLDLFGPSVGRARSAKVFEWLAATMSLQGISDQVAQSYMSDYGRPRWASIARGVKTGNCPLLKSYWHFHGCHYRKAAHSCALPGLIDTCPLPAHRFRNGNLNQLAYSLFLFIRDVVGGDLVSWIDGRLAEADDGLASDRVAQMADAIIGPLSGVHGVAGKVLSMVLSDLLVVGNEHNPRWGQVGGSLIAIDTLVHNFLVRTGILKRANAVHPYGPQCYGPTGCAAVLSALSDAIDARQFNSAFPRVFPRYVQRAIWAYCAEDGLHVCNGRTIKDGHRCKNLDCRLYFACDRLALRGKAAQKA